MLIDEFKTKSNRPTILCLGGFDSIHSGHVSLIEHALSLKKTVGGNVAVTLFCYDENVLEKKSGGEVFTFSERVSILENLGVDEVIKIDFNEQFSKLTPLEFLNELCDNRPISRVICGNDFKFGVFGGGNVKYLTDYFKNKNVCVTVVPFVLNGRGEKISTTQVKAALAAGEVRKCFAEFKVKYFISGEVVFGRQDGRKIGFPTANIIPPKEKFQIKSGVYACTVFVGGKKYRAISNLGDAPTFGVEKRVLECHIDGFSGDLYGKNLTVYFDDFIRDIRKFDSVEQLKIQLEKDLSVIR